MRSRSTARIRGTSWPSALTAFVVIVGLLLGAQLGLSLIADRGFAWDSTLTGSLYHAVVLVAAGALALRAIRGPDGRLGWALIAGGLVAWIASDIAAQAGAGNPIPGGFRIAFYGAALVGLLVLAKGQPVKATAKLDGAIIMLGLLTVWSWLVLDHAIERRNAGDGELVSALAYPLFDLTLGLVLVAVFLRHGWPRSGPWLMIGFAFALTVIADTVAAIEAGGSLASGTDPLLDAAWAAGAMLLGVAALTAPEPRAAPGDRVGREFSFGLAVAFIAFATLVLVGGRFEPIAIPTLVFAALTLVLGVTRTTGIYLRRTRTESELRSPGLAELSALVRAADEREHVPGRSDRVALYAAAVAVRLGLDVDRVERVVLAAKLRAVGRAEAPDEVLMTSGEPSPDELEGAGRHPAESERTVAAAGFPDAARWIRHHRERWDGDGYPDGLSEGQIPLESRILAIAEALEAMTSRGPDREALSAEMAAVELRALAGSRFDPGIARVLVDLLRRGAIHVRPAGGIPAVADASKHLGMSEYLRVEAMLSGESSPNPGSRPESREATSDGPPAADQPAPRDPAIGSVGDGAAGHRRSPRAPAG